MGKKGIRFICFFFTLFAAVQAGQAITGDTNGDNLVTIIDALITAQHSVGLSVPDYDAAGADVNGDKAINILDALIVAQYYVGLISAFPVDIGLLMGDVNGDSSVNIIDALQVSQYYIGLNVSGFNSMAADVDSNEIVDIIDALLIARYFVKIITEFPVNVSTPTPGPSLPPPFNLTAVRDYVDLDSEEEDKLNENGFVILGSKSTFDTLTESYSQLMTKWDVPSFITSDSLLHVFHLTFADMLIKLENYFLYSRLKTLVNDLDTAVSNEYPGLPAGSLLQTAGKNLRVFTAAAKALVNGETVFSGTAVDDIPGLVNDMLDNIYNCKSPQSSSDNEDYTAYKVKSHYTATAELERYYRTMKWLQRKRFYIVDDNSPENEDIALVTSAILARIITRGAGALLTQWEWLYAFNTKITGTIPCITLVQVNTALISVFGDSYTSQGYAILSDSVNRALLQSKLESEADPKGKFVQFMGEPYLMDEEGFRSVLYPAIPGRFFPTGFDMAAMVLNSLPAFELLADEEQIYPGYLQKLGNKALDFTNLPETQWESSLYNSWYCTLRSLSSPLTGSVPGWMKNSTWQKEKMNSQMSSWVELHNDYVNLEIEAATPTPTPTATPTRTHAATGSPGTVWISPVSQVVTYQAGFKTSLYVNTGSQLLAAYGFTITYSQSLLAVNTSVGISGVDAGSNGFVSAVNNNIPGIIQISGFDTIGKGPETSLHLLDINWTAGSQAGSSTIMPMVNTLADSDYNTIGTPNGTGAMVAVGPITPSITPTRTISRTATRSVTRTATRTKTPSPTPTPTHMPCFVEPYPVFYSRLSGMCKTVIDLIDTPEITLDHDDRFRDISAWAEEFGVYARKIRNNESLTPDQYRYIKNWGLELINFFGSGTILPEYEGKTKVIADYFTHEDQVMHIATGKLHPVIILYNVHGIEDSFAAVGYVVSYYEILKTGNYHITDEEWETILETNAAGPAPWRSEFWLD